jgi:LmbE family N-acetylglucosaminyl deacetylase
MGLNLVKKFLFKRLNYKFAKIIASVNLKPKELEINQNTKNLCICPHADDESIGMGGTLALFGQTFDVILATDGRKGIKNVPVEDVIKTREEEFSKAMQIANVKNFKFLKAKDKDLINSYELFKTIKLEDYDNIFIPNIIDQHPDHKAIGILLNRLFEEEAKTKANLQICFYEVWSTLGFVNGYQDIESVIEKKKSMINSYASQTATKDYEYYALGLNRYRGMFKDKKYVEAFCIMDKSEFQQVAQLY